MLTCLSRNRTGLVNNTNSGFGLLKCPSRQCSFKPGHNTLGPLKCSSKVLYEKGLFINRNVFVFHTSYSWQFLVLGFHCTPARPPALQITMIIHGLLHLIQIHKSVTWRGIRVYCTCNVNPPATVRDELNGQCIVTQWFTMNVPRGELWKGTGATQVTRVYLLFGTDVSVSLNLTTYFGGLNITKHHQCKLVLSNDDLGSFLVLIVSGRTINTKPKILIYPCISDELK